jgi:hypothetical protein
MKKFSSYFPMLGALLCLSSIGCEEPQLPESKPATPSAEAPPVEEPPMVAGAPGKELPETEVPVTDIPRKFLASDPIQGRRSRREAKEGTNVLGIGSDVAAGMYAKHQMIIHSIDHALQLYVPQHNFEYPKTQEEFMKDVVALALNGVPLPKIEDDHEYCYVPSQPERGLQIRLKPGSPKSKVPAGTSPEDAIKMLAGSEEEGAAPATSEPSTEAGVDPSATEEPSPDIRTRAGQLGEERNEEIEKRGLAPGGLAPVGGLGE